MRFSSSIESEVEGDVVVAGDDELEFCRVGGQEGHGEDVLGIKTCGGEVSGVDEDVCEGEGVMEGKVMAGEVGLGGAQEVRI